MLKDGCSLGLLIIVLGVGAVLVGVGLYFGWLSWLGRLPGDVRIERPGFRFYLPLTSMLLVSVVLTLIVNLLRRLF